MKKLYVGNLPFSATEDTLHEFFSQSGVNPSAVNLIRDRFTGQSRGFAFVEISNDEEADRAVNSLNGQNFGGRNLVVNEARPQEQRPRRTWWRWRWARRRWPRRQRSWRSWRWRRPWRSWQPLVRRSLHSVGGANPSRRRFYPSLIPCCDSFASVALFCHSFPLTRMTSHPCWVGRRQRPDLPRRNFILIYVFETSVEENHSSSGFCSMVSLADVITVVASHCFRCMR